MANRVALALAFGVLVSACTSSGSSPTQPHPCDAMCSGTLDAESGSVADSDTPEASDATPMPGPPSGFVGRWLLGKGDGSGGCTPPGVSGFTLDPAAATIEQVSSTELHFSTFALGTGTIQCSNQVLTLTSSKAWSAQFYGCFGIASGSISLTIDADAGLELPDGGVAAGGAGVPAALDMAIAGQVDNPPCAETYAFVLNRTF